MNEPSFCRRCSSKKFVKKGKVFTNTMKGVWKQKYQCLDCGFKFSGNTLHISEPMPFVYQSKPVPSQDWVAYTKAQNVQKLKLMDLVTELMDLLEFRISKSVGRNNVDFKEMLFCMLLKTYTRMPSRKLISDLQIAKDRGLIQNVPHFTTIMNYFGDERFTYILHTLIRISALPLRPVERDFSADSSGFSSSQFGRWFDHKFGKEVEKRHFLKAHFWVGVKSNVITAVEITDESGSDYSQFIPLLNKTKIDFNIKEVSADKAYLGKSNLEAVAAIDATPYIPYKSNTIPKRNVGHIWNKMYWHFKNNPQKWGEHYHKRSNVESTFNMVKQAFSGSLMTKNNTANVNEILCNGVNPFFGQ